MPVLIKDSFKQQLSLEQFYSGGAVFPALGGIILVCFNGNALSLLSLPEGKFFASISVSSDPDDILTAMAVHPNGEKLLVASRQLTIYVIDLSQRVVLKSFKPGHTRAITYISFDETGYLFATASADRSVRVYDLDQLQCTHCFRDLTSVGSKTLFLYDLKKPTELLYLIALSQTELHVYELFSKKKLGTVTGHLAPIASMTLLENVLVTSGGDGVLIFTLIEDGTLTVKKTVHVHATFLDMCVAGDSILGPSNTSGDMLRFVISECFSQKDGKGHMFGKKTRGTYVDHFASRGLNLNKGSILEQASRHFCFAALDLKLLPQYTYDLEDVKEHTSYVHLNAFPTPSRTPGAQHFLLSATTSDNLIMLFDLMTLEYIEQPDIDYAVTDATPLPLFHASLLTTICSDSGEVLDIRQISRSEIAVATSAHHIRIIRYHRNAETGAVTLLKSYSCYGHDDYVSGLSANVDHEVFCTSSRDGTARVWKRLVPLEYQEQKKSLSSKTDESFVPFPTHEVINPWVCVAVLTGAEKGIDCITFCADPRWICITGSGDKILRFYDLSWLARLGEKIQAFHTTADPQYLVESCQISEYGPSSSLLAHTDAITSLDCTQHGLLASVSADLSLKLWNVQNVMHPTFLVEQKKAAKKAIWSVEFSRFEKLLALSSGSKLIHLFHISGPLDTPVLQPYKSLEGHVNAVMRTTFVSKGQQLISVGADGLIKVWNISTSECVLTLVNERQAQDLGLGIESPHKMWAVVAIDDGADFVTGDGLGVVRWYTDETEEVALRQHEEEKMRLLQVEELEATPIDSKENLIRAFRLAFNMHIDLSRDRNSPAFRKRDKHLQSVLQTASSVSYGVEAVAEAVQIIGLLQASEILAVARRWSQSSRLSQATLTLLLGLFRAYTPDVIVDAYQDGVAESVRGLLRNVERILERVRTLQGESALIELNKAHMTIH
ncbi:WD40 repeat protein [Giardia muris]|uniref:WD40 repeat protein n=1 Tax=Giardia muris TaxID=5742 RepID=A0A4Z1T8P5_GIAMU|nr:WD40 repeat protein [Giardia muris]|eukprot:TNJ28949.1 WD40 repeat protein [Giardia muris]